MVSNDCREAFYSRLKLPLFMKNWIDDANALWQTKADSWKTIADSWKDYLPKNTYNLQDSQNITNQQNNGSCNLWITGIENANSQYITILKNVIKKENIAYFKVLIVKNIADLSQQIESLVTNGYSNFANVFIDSHGYVYDNRISQQYFLIGTERISEYNYSNLSFLGLHLHPKMGKMIILACHLGGGSDVSKSTNFIANLSASLGGIEIYIGMGFVQVDNYSEDKFHTFVAKRFYQNETEFDTRNFPMAVLYGLYWKRISSDDASNIKIDIINALSVNYRGYISATPEDEINDYRVKYKSIILEAESSIYK